MNTTPACGSARSSKRSRCRRSCPTPRSSAATWPTTPIEVEWGDAQIGKALKVSKQPASSITRSSSSRRTTACRFPFVKGQIHEDGFHLPLAMRWGEGIKPGRVVEDFVNVRDLAPTYMELAGLKPHEQMTGKSLAGILRSRAFRLDRKPRFHARRQGAARHRPAERSGLSRAGDSHQGFPLRPQFPSRALARRQSRDRFRQLSIPARPRKSSSCSAATSTSCRSASDCPTSCIASPTTRSASAIWPTIWRSKTSWKSCATN